jgi:hypothetical protein
MTAEPNTNDLATAALRYAADGYEIFPANPNNKAPLTVNGMKDATSDVTTNPAMVERPPNSTHRLSDTRRRHRARRRPTARRRHDMGRT